MKVPWLNILPLRGMFLLEKIWNKQTEVGIGGRTFTPGLCAVCTSKISIFLLKGVYAEHCPRLVLAAKASSGGWRWAGSSSWLLSWSTLAPWARTCHINPHKQQDTCWDPSTHLCCLPRPPHFSAYIELLPDRTSIPGTTTAASPPASGADEQSGRGEESIEMLPADAVTERWGAVLLQRCSCPSVAEWPQPLLPAAK